jgi:two-component system response regulator CpxR
LTGDGYEALILDVMMPGLNGFDVLRELRARTVNLPVLMLTARGEDVDRIVGLELGADDYLPKPFNPRELVARLRAILRRGTLPAANAQVKVGDVELRTGDRSVRRGGRPVELTGAEFSVLEVLLRAAGRVVARDALSEQALGRPLGRYDRSLDMHVSNLRKKLGPGPGGEPRIRAVRGQGYLYPHG